MFAELHAIAQMASLIIVVAADGADLRVSVMPHQANGVPMPDALYPIHLSGTPEKVDGQFAEAMARWQAHQLYKAAPEPVAPVAAGRASSGGAFNDTF